MERLLMTLLMAFMLTMMSGCRSQSPKPTNAAPDCWVVYATHSSPSGTTRGDHTMRNITEVKSFVAALSTTGLTGFGINSYSGWMCKR